MSVNIRIGKKEDLAATLALVRELAVFERAPREVEVSIEEMMDWGFGENKLFDFFVLEKDNAIVAMALYYYKYSTWKGKCLFLEDIIVTEKERGKGFGKLLFNEVVSVAKKEKVRRMEWQVLEWNASALQFYKRYKALEDDEWINCKLTFEQLQNSAL
ncbi:MAG: GNAT family N-acetyltransferase [bacterium]|nr:GNAT family N-acetyltransferase [bacterium]